MKTQLRRETARQVCILYCSPVKWPFKVPYFGVTEIMANVGLLLHISNCLCLTSEGFPAVTSVQYWNRRFRLHPLSFFVLSLLSLRVAYSEIRYFIYPVSHTHAGTKPSFEVQETQLFYSQRNSVSAMHFVKWPFKVIQGHRWKGLGLFPLRLRIALRGER